MDDLEGAGPVAAEPEDREVLVQRRYAQDAKSLHDREARPVDDREILVGEALPDRESNLEVGRRDRLDGGGAAPDGLPIPLGRVPTQTVREQEPGLDEDVVARQEPLAAREDALCAAVAAVAAVGRRVEDRAVDEQGQRAASTASPT